MLYRRILIPASIVVSLLAGAMSQKAFDPKPTDSYGRLLSKHYHQIAHIEKKLGTFSHQEHFSSLANDVKDKKFARVDRINRYTNAKKYRKELKQMRQALTDAINGHIFHANPNAVAAMQASYECRLKNIGINKHVDQACRNAFLKAQEQIQYASINTPPKENLVNFTQEEIVVEEKIEYNIETEIVDNSNVNIDPNKKEQLSFENDQSEVNIAVAVAEEGITDINNIKENISQKIDSNILDTQDAVIANKIQKDKLPQETANALPKIASQKVLPQKGALEENVDNIPQYQSNLSISKQLNNLKEVDTVQRPIRNKKLVPINKKSVSELTPSISPDFNPADYVHPSMRQRATEIHKLHNKIDNTIQEDPDVSYGIKPLNKVKASDNSLHSPMTKNIHAKEIATDSAPTSSIKKIEAPRPQYDQFVISFEQGGATLSKESKTYLQDIKKRLNQNNYTEVDIIGHSDSEGKDNINDMLSYRRAHSIYKNIENILKKKNIKQVNVDGVGANVPLQGVSPSDDRNRRVTINLVY